jgi:hypothetical protein
MAWTRVDGWVWVFACVDYTAEVWVHVAKVGDRFALQPVYDAVIDRWGRLKGDIARAWSSLSAMIGFRRAFSLSSSLSRLTSSAFSPPYWVRQR